VNTPTIPLLPLRRRTRRPRLAAFALLARLVRGPESHGRVSADGKGGSVRQSVAR
jgi:hypothetical protein